MKSKEEYFTKFPNEYIQCNIKKDLGVSRKFYITYILIDKYRTRENYSWITIRKILNFYGYKTSKNKPKAMYEVLDVLEYMINNKMIEVEQDLDSLQYDTGIEIKIITDNFDYPERFTMITSSQLNTIMMADSSLNKENILMAFLYINSYIGCRKKDIDGFELNDARKCPEAFWRSTDVMATDMGMSKTTINQCLSYLTSNNNNNRPLLIKGETGFLQDDNSKRLKAAPNIYVINKVGYEKEIEWALEKMKEVFGVKHFYKKTESKGE